LTTGVVERLIVSIHDMSYILRQPDLSTNTRKYMEEALKEKYPQHFQDDKD